MTQRFSAAKIDTPILVIGFNRPDKISQLLDRLVELGAENVFISLDGPRSQAETAVCTATREQAEKYSSNFQLSMVWRDKNLGCCLGVVSALDWFFEKNECGIVLEDDCYPEEDMLSQIQDNLPRISYEPSTLGMLTAHNPFLTWPTAYFSEYFLIQGWATSAKVWKQVRDKYFELTSPQLIKNMRRGRSIPESIYWWANSTRARLGGIDTWDGIFADRMWRLNYKTLIPKINLVTNHGFDERATHTKNPEGSIFVNVSENDKYDFDSLMRAKYFRIKRRHAFTAPLKVFLDLLFHRRKNNEVILQKDKINRIEKFYSS